MQVIRTILSLYIVIIIIDSILSYFPDYQSKDWRLKIKKMADLTCGPVREKLPDLHLPIDVSPIIVIFLIELFKILW